MHANDTDAVAKVSHPVDVGTAAVSAALIAKKNSPTSLAARTHPLTHLRDLFERNGWTIRRGICWAHILTRSSCWLRLNHRIGSLHSSSGCEMSNTFGRILIFSFVRLFVRLLQSVFPVCNVTCLDCSARHCESPRDGSALSEHVPLMVWRPLMIPGRVSANCLPWGTLTVLSSSSAQNKQKKKSGDHYF